LTRRLTRRRCEPCRPSTGCHRRRSTPRT
jgi:hypothetical protein